MSKRADELKALLSAANLTLPVAVEYDSDVLGDYGPVVSWAWRIKGICDFQNEEASDERAELVAAALNALPDLLAVLDAATEHLREGNLSHSWRCEYRTAVKGWKEGEPPVVECVCGLDNLDVAVARFNQEEGT